MQSPRPPTTPRPAGPLGLALVALALVALPAAHPRPAEAREARAGQAGAGQVGAGQPGAGQDNRVRIAQLLRLGRSHTPEARGELERALQDSSESIRLTASVALIALGDPAAIPALERRLTIEPAPRVRERLEAARTELRDVALKRARFALQLGRMMNATQSRNPALVGVMATAARARASSVPGVVLLEGPSDPLYARARERNLPVFVLDGQLSQLARSSAPGGVSLAANVELLIRAVPSQALKGTLRGTSRGTESSSAMASHSRLAELENQVVGSAVESALRGAESALAVASK